MTGESDAPASDVVRSPEEAMRRHMDASTGGAVIDLLPRGTDTHVALGISAAVEALRDNNEPAAKAALETAAAQLDGRDTGAEQ